MTLQLKRFFLILLCLLPAIPTATTAQEDEDETEAAQEEATITDYIEMDPSFVTHVGEPGDKLTYLKASVTIRASKETTRPAVEAHMPRLRHKLVMLFGEQTDADRLATSEGQAALRDEAKQRINAVLAEQQTGETITGVLFTEFVVQR
ncbi:flagellar basal body-associated FliL family protein [Marinobacter sp. NP-4(2019)]|uniref:flagellar basal body-associated FliL family protein n=1 Tax=Marinobacter sp. NP-4(2019) TaxID=2488665 RepID=UPI000FC3ED8F|nr:flagellar basal body-associated FliL family protein [Marinobacter sp. NP-4(2019)]AZT82619.1 flagellar basal body-associated FliL family protein [Marinobacter sp. NP-4(2019)]